MLGRLTADQRAAGLNAPFGDPGDDRGHPLGADPAAHHVVGEKQRFRPADREIVDDHGDQVDPDGAVDAELLRDRHLGANAVGRRCQQRPPVGGEPGGVEEPGEAADAPDDLGPGGAGHGIPDQVHGPVSGREVDPSPRVAQGVGSARTAGNAVGARTAGNIVSAGNVVSAGSSH
jgi:hypothetical protein